MRSNDLPNDVKEARKMLQQAEQKLRQVIYRHNRLMRHQELEAVENAMAVLRDVRHQLGDQALVDWSI